MATVDMAKDTACGWQLRGQSNRLKAAGNSAGAAQQLREIGEKLEILKDS